MLKTAIDLNQKQVSRLKNNVFASGTFLLLLLWPACWATAQPVRRCLTQQHDAWLKAQNPGYAQSRALLDQLLLQSQASGRTKAQNEEKIVIPVVVHVVHNNASGRIGGPKNPNISDEQIRSQIEVLNEDYQRKEGTPGFNTSPVGADFNIEFRLAIRAPDGSPTTGITRHYSSKSSYSETEMEQLANIVYWPTNRYLNIWVTSIAGNYIGYAQFPDMSGLEGLGNENRLEKTDGVLIDYGHFGRDIGTTTQGIYTKGRTTTHEVGHWLGLLHTWGDIECESGDCVCGTDYIDDTPPAAKPNNDLDCPELFSTCSGETTRNMIENYMDYSPDNCMNIFTLNQKDRVRRVLELSPRRKALVESALWELPEAQKLEARIYNNPPAPGTRTIYVEVLLNNSQDVTISLYNTTGQLINEKRIASTPSTILPLTVASLNAGVYLVRISTPTETQVKRLVLLD